MSFDLAKREVKPVDLQRGMVAGEVRDCECHRSLSVSLFTALKSLSARMLGWVVFVLFSPNNPNRGPGRRALAAVSVVAAALGALAFASAPALAASPSEPGPAWRLTAQSVPTNVAPGGEGLILLQVDNIGDAPSVLGSPITVVDQLPPGMTATEAGALASGSLAPDVSGPWGNCAITEKGVAVEKGRTVTCTYRVAATIAPISATPDRNEEVGLNSHSLAPPIGIDVSLEESAAGALVDLASVSGGGALGAASDTASVTVSNAVAPFGLASFHQWSTNIDGMPTVQAGSHPYETTTRLMLNNELEGAGATSNGVVRDFHVELPPGFVGDPNAVPKCTRADFDVRLYVSNTGASCPPDTQVGVAFIYLEPTAVYEFPVYNLVPPTGVPAQFGVTFEKYAGFLDAGIHPSLGGTYDLVVNSRDIQTSGVAGVSVYLWGDPAAPTHDKLRYPQGQNEIGPGNDVPDDDNVGLKPFLSLPTSCGIPQTLAVSAVSWEDPLQTAIPFTGVAASTDEQGNPAIIGGCSKLDFSPSLELTPESSATSTPTGLEANLRLPQNEDPNGLVEADLKSAIVTLPPGLTVSPSAANGLESCTPEQLGVTGSGNTMLFSEAQPTCPAASKIGDVEVATPLIGHPLQGEIYLAQQETVEGSLIGAYLVVDDPQSGILVKLRGTVELGGQAGVIGLRPGQVRAKFLYSPQVPFSDLKVHFFGGPRASLVTPSACAANSATTQITGWNGTVATPASNPVAIDSGCSEGFSPAFVAGTTSGQAGAFTDLTVALSRSDSEQGLLGLSVVLAPGLLGKLAGVPQCSNAAANEGACPESSQLGTVTVAGGAGPEPVYVHGRMFLTGPYRGGPFGEVVEVPAIAGPFDLDENGRPVVVRGSIQVNPTTAQAEVVSDPFPTELRGVQLDERSVSVSLDRPGFMFNPTNCGQMAVTGAVTSTRGAIANVSSPFAVANCSGLKFKPGFVVSTAGRASKADGASLDVRVTYPYGPQGTYANIKSVRVDLPKQLPSRLTTLQKACLAATFEANPAKCPAASVVGTAIATTPVLTHSLTGPAFLVSHGNEAFPDLEMVLQGEGVTLILDGNTSIKRGITSSTFRSIPDAPVSSFELKLPTGPYSILGANVPQSAKYSLCNQALAMPTAITGQNGAVIKQSTKITATNCLKPKQVKKAISKRKKPVKSTRRGK